MAKLKKQNIPFTQVANEVLNDTNLSWKAKGLFAYLFSKPDGWDFAGKRISKDSSDGSKATYSGLKELEDAGYLGRKKHGNGRVDYNLGFTENPYIISPIPEQFLKDPVSRNGKQPKRQLAETGTISNTDSESNKDKKEIQVSNEVAGKDIQEVINLFKEVNPSYRNLFANKTQRAAALRLVTLWPRPKLDNLIGILPQTNARKFWPKITTPLELERQAGVLKAKLEEERQQQKKGGVVL